MFAGARSTVSAAASPQVGRDRRAQPAAHRAMTDRKPPVTRHTTGKPPQKVTRNSPTHTGSDDTRNEREDITSSVTRNDSSSQMPVGLDDHSAGKTARSRPETTRAARGKARRAGVWSPNDIAEDSAQPFHVVSEDDLRREREKVAARQRERRARLRSEGVTEVRLEVPAHRAAEVKDAVVRYLAGETPALRPSLGPDATPALQKLQSELDGETPALLARFAALLASPHAELRPRIRKRLELLESDAEMLGFRASPPRRVPPDQGDT